MMNITKDLALLLLEESPSFRKWAAGQLITVNGDIRDQVLGYLFSNKKLKIQCIKHIRDEFTGQELTTAFPEYDDTLGYGQIGLVEAKNFVEHYFKVLF